MKPAALLIVLLCAQLVPGQEVRVASGKNGTTLSVLAAKPYQLAGSEQKKSALSVECAVKGKARVHVVIFSPGTGVSDDASGNTVLVVTLDGKQAPTLWAPYGSLDSFAFVGSTEPERVQFLQALLEAKSVSISFKPFLTGMPVTSAFDLSQLKAEMDKHPGCAMP
jgi:hypothetical protein